MVWFINKIRETGCSSTNDILHQSTNFLFNIHSSNYTSFDLYYLWRVGVNIFNVDRTVHDDEFFKETCSKISEARNFYTTDTYRSIGVAVTMSAAAPVEVNEDVDIIIVKDILKKEDLFKFRKKYSRLNLPILLWMTITNILDDTNFLIKLSDGVVFDFHNEKKILQPHCIFLFKKCREMHKPIILSRPVDIAEYINKCREVLPIAKKLVDLSLDGILLEDTRCHESVVYAVYSLLTAMVYIDSTKQKEERIRNYMEIRAELKIPVLQPLSVAHAASLAALNSEATLIIVPSRSGRSAKWIACARPPCHVMVVTTQASTARKLHVYKQIMPLLYDQPSASTWHAERWNRIRFGTDFALKIGLLDYGAKFVVLSQHGNDGYCNSFHILTAPGKEIRTCTY